MTSESDSSKLDRILSMLADLDRRVTKLEESKGGGSQQQSGDSDQSDQDSAEQCEGQSEGQDSDSESSASGDSDSDSSESDQQGEGESAPADDSEPFDPEEWKTPDPVKNEFPEEEKPRKATAPKGTDQTEDDGDTCDAFNCRICAGKSMRASVEWSDDGSI